MIPKKKKVENEKKRAAKEIQLKEIPAPSRFINKWVIFGVPCIVALYCLTSDNALALEADDAMKTTSEALEKILTGSWLRVGLLAGMIGGVVMSAVKQSPIIFAGSMGTGLGALYYKGWVADSFTALI